MTPLTGLPPLSFTVACSAVANAVLMSALCGVPAVVTMLAAASCVIGQTEAGRVATPVQLAITV